jgi:hypothetical protein
VICEKENRKTEDLKIRRFVHFPHHFSCAAGQSTTFVVSPQQQQQQQQAAARKATNKGFCIVIPITFVAVCVCPDDGILSSGGLAW